MRLLIIGGTRFVGRHMAESAIERGHDVTVFHRGKTGADDLPKATRILGDRDKDLTNLDGQSWDATIDACAYVPRQVANSRTRWETAPDKWRSSQQSRSMPNPFPWVATKTPR